MTESPEAHLDRKRGEPALRLAHVLFVLWGAGVVAWAFYAAAIAHDRGWWDFDPILAAALVLVPPVLAHILALILVRLTGNPRFGKRPDPRRNLR